MTDTTHRHEFHLTETFVGRESGATFYVARCECGKRETTLANGRAV